MQTNEIIINDQVSFATYGVGTVNNVSNGIVLGICSGAMVQNKTAAMANHAIMYPNLPTSTPVPNDYKKYNYWQIQLIDSTLVEIGIPWVNPLTLTRTSRKTCTTVLPDFDETRLQALRDLYVANGFLNAVVSIVG